MTPERWQKVRDVLGQAGEQKRHAADVAIVLARLIGATIDNVIERVPIDFGVALDESFDGDGGEIVGADSGERSTVTTEGSSNRITDVGRAHRRPDKVPRALSYMEERWRANGADLCRCSTGIFPLAWRRARGPVEAAR